ncbi:hypothetical protein GQ44DRAFT_744878 [Phaeosphaeriaceae sp. PMI808]|nr:hypothetical protein GQ44DRAFT_744878 [Phaeosphaeriaceae sp. PMI808]
MRVHNLLLLGSTSLVSATPMPKPQGVGQGADSCASDPLSVDTWNTLKVDDFLVEAVKSYTPTTTNNIQSLADSFGAPNFFCGLDKFCNAGQPCLPIKLPAWYAAIAIQNWNNYMNALNTAITFASSIISLKLSEIVTDVYPDAKDDITPLKNLGSIFGAVLGIIPFTGPIATGVGLANSGLGFVLGRVKPPKPADKFIAWTNVASSVGDLVRDYQATVSNTIKAILDAPIDNPDNGINAVLKGGGFLGVSQNFTQTDIQDKVIDAITMNAIGLALQAQKIFIHRLPNLPDCDGVIEDAAFTCRQDEGAETFTGLSMLRADKNANAVRQTDLAQKLMDKYGMSQEQILKSPADCFDLNNQKQLTNAFDTDTLPTDPKGPCVFNLINPFISFTYRSSYGVTHRLTPSPT